MIPAAGEHRRCAACKTGVTRSPARIFDRKSRRFVRQSSFDCYLPKLASKPDFEGLQVIARERAGVQAPE
jgi:hypothetical protein